MYKIYTLDNQFIKETDNFPSNFTGIIEVFDGTKAWYLNGTHHRLDGPAYNHINGSKEWRVKGKYHRVGGPASERPNGTNRWFVDGKQVTEQQHDLLFNMLKLKGLI